MSYLDALIYGVRDLFQGSTALARRARLSFGSGFTLTDDADNAWTRVEVSAASAQGDAAGVFEQTATAVRWSPAGVSSVYGLTAAGFTSTVDATPVDVFPALGDPDAEEIDAADFVCVASAIVTMRVPATGLAETFRVSRTFARDGGGAVAAVEATSDDGSHPAAPTLTVPVLAWDTATKAPKLTVTGDATDTTNIRATFTFLVHTG
jgi:hypothetical protein